MRKKSVFSKVKDLKVSTFIEHCKETQNTHHTVITAPLWGTTTGPLSHCAYTQTHRCSQEREWIIPKHDATTQNSKQVFASVFLLLLYLEAARNQPHHTASKPLSPNLLIPPASHRLALQPHHTSTNSAAWSSM